MKKCSMKDTFNNNLPFVLFLALIFSFRSSVADWYHVPSGSMEPTIQIGDRVVVDKSAYTLELPFTDIVLKNTGEIARGDIVIIDSSAADMRLIKRVIATEGDTVKLVENRLYINGKKTELTALGAYTFYEEVLGHRRVIALNPTSSPASSFNTINVPQGYFLAMGDNRNNSVDSRYYGFIPIEEVEGKANTVAFSLDVANHYVPRAERFFKTLE